jgi:hypothetical protein
VQDRPCMHELSELGCDRHVLRECSRCASRGTRVGARLCGSTGRRGFSSAGAVFSGLSGLAGSAISIRRKRREVECLAQAQWVGDGRTPEDQNECLALLRELQAPV